MVDRYWPQIELARFLACCFLVGGVAGAVIAVIRGAIGGE